MEVNINGKTEDVSVKTIADLAILKKVPAKGVAITVNGAVVPRRLWADTSIVPNAKIIIIKAFAGG